MIIEYEDKYLEDVRDLFAMLFTTYHLSENYKIIYKKDSECTIPKKLIELYEINNKYNVCYNKY